MADTKISALTAAATLVGTETLPVVQSGATVKATVQSLSNFMPTYTWATLPAAASNSGLKVRVSDVGVSGSEWRSNGTTWEPVGGRVLLARVHTDSAVTGTTAETVLATVTIPAGLMGVNGSLWVYHNFTIASPAASAKYFRATLGGTVFGVYTTSSAAVVNISGAIPISNRNSQSAQYAGGGMFFSAGATSPVAGTVDTSVAQTFTLTAQPGAVGETTTLRVFSLELVR